MQTLLRGGEQSNQNSSGQKNHPQTFLALIFPFYKDNLVFTGFYKRSLDIELNLLLSRLIYFPTTFSLPIIVRLPFFNHSEDLKLFVDIYLLSIIYRDKKNQRED